VQTTTCVLVDPKRPVDRHADPLRIVVEHYHEALCQTSRAMAYLDRLGLDAPQLSEHFRLGFSDRTLCRGIAALGKQGRVARDRLVRLGVWRASGHEHLRGCLVAPVFDESGIAWQCHARQISAPQLGAVTARTLPGAGPGVWNAPSVVVGGDLIVCDEVLSALKIWSLGEHQVVACSRADGTAGLTMLYDLVRAKRTARVSIAFAADAWGQDAARHLSVLLAADRVESRRVPLPRGFDIHTYARLQTFSAGGPGAFLRGLRHSRLMIGPACSVSRTRPMRSKLATTPAQPATLTVDIAAHLVALEQAGYATATLAARRAHLGVTARAMLADGVVDTASVTPAALNRVLHTVTRDGASGSGANIVTAVRMFFAWAARTQRLDTNPSIDVERPRSPRHLPRAILSIGEVERVLAQPRSTTVIGLRDRAILEVLYSTGIRRMELIGLDLSDLDAERGVLLVREGKGRKDRYVPIGGRAVLWAHRYLDASRPRLARAGDLGALFLSSHGNRMRPTRLTAHLHAHILAAGVGKSGSCHIFRHTMATLMHDAGADIRDLQAMLGHALVSTTQLYTHVSLARLKAVHSRTHPAGHES
jgi:integrase/recombinase XerD